MISSQLEGTAQDVGMQVSTEDIRSAVQTIATVLRSIRDRRVSATMAGMAKGHWKPSSLVDIEIFPDGSVALEVDGEYEPHVDTIDELLTALGYDHSV